MTGAVTSRTVKVVVQTALLPLASVTVMVTTCTPTPTTVPAAGLCTLTICQRGVVLSVTWRRDRKFGTRAMPLELASTVVEDGQMSTGGAESTVVTVKRVVH